MSEKVTIKVERKSCICTRIALPGLVVFPTISSSFGVGREKKLLPPCGGNAL